MTKKNLFRLIALILFPIFISQNGYGQNSENLYQKIDLFGEVLETIKEEYVEEVDQVEIMDAAINGILQSLDPYSAYMSPKVYNNMQTETKGKFGGLGIEVGMEGGVVKVISPIDGTPAYDAGIKAGDFIIKIDGEQVQGKTLMEAVNLMRGLPGTTIELTIIRKSLKKSKNFTIKRDIIEIRSVVSEIIDKSIGYLRLSSFNENSSNQLKNKISDLEKKNNLSGYILDLRNNPGGLLSQAINVSDFFLNDGEIVSTKGRHENENKKYFAKKGDKIEGKPLIVLINYGSASASEIVAGALQDQKRAILLGETTYGKGSVQSIIPLKNNGAIRLTISKYYLPSGKSISEVGIVPDIKVEEDEKLDSEIDTQLNYAIKLLKS